MRRLVLVLVLTSAAGFGQDRSPSAPAQIDPWRMKALENGLRGLKLSDSVQLDVRPGPAPAGDRQCGHIRILPVRPDVDRKIIVRPFKPGDASMSRMPVHKGLPPCPSGNR